MILLYATWINGLWKGRAIGPKLIHTVPLSSVGLTSVPRDSTILGVPVLVWGFLRNT